MVVNAAAISLVGPVDPVVGAVGRRVLEDALVKIDDVASAGVVVVQMPAKYTSPL